MSKNPLKLSSWLSLLHFKQKSIQSRFKIPKSRTEFHKIRKTVNQSRIIDQLVTKIQQIAPFSSENPKNWWIDEILRTERRHRWKRGLQQILASDTKIGYLCSIELFQIRFNYATSFFRFHRVVGWMDDGEIHSSKFALPHMTMMMCNLRVFKIWFFTHRATIFFYIFGNEKPRVKGKI